MHWGTSAAEGAAVQTEARATEEAAPHPRTISTKESAEVPSSRRGLHNPDFVSRAAPSPFGQLAYSTTIEEALSSPVIETASAFLVLVNCFVVASETLPSLQDDVFFLLRCVEDVTSVYFSVEYLLRWYSRSLRPAYLIKPLMLVDLLSNLPLFLSEAGVDTGRLAFLRLLRVLRLQRFVRDFESFEAFTAGFGLQGQAKPYQLELARVVSSIFTLLFIATGLIYNAEHEVNPQIPDYFTALYFGLTTLTTVGFGDITPITVEGRLIVCLSILAGVAVVPAQLSSLADALLSRSVVADPPPTSAQRALACPVHGDLLHRRDASFCFRCGARLILAAESGTPE